MNGHCPAQTCSTMCSMNFNLQACKLFGLAPSFFIADSGKRKKKGNELEQIDCTPPEHILPGSKERPLVPLQPQNKDWKVRNSLCLDFAFRPKLITFCH